MRTRLVGLFVLISFVLNAQLSKHETSYLSQCLLSQVNELRESKNLNPLLPDSSLVLAAQLHSTYMARVGRLSHKESSSKLRTPSLRVKKYSDEFELVGENILFIENKKKHLKDEAIEAVAKEMFIAWKESPGHYANMIHPNYEIAGFGFARSKKGKLYATHVIGTKGIVIRGQLSENAFGIKPHAKACDSFLNSKRNFVINMGNSIRVYDGKVSMFYHSKALFEKMLPNEQDGIAVDIVTREQFECGSENILDLSPYYDGVMLKPVYKNELFKNNSAQSDYRIVTEVGVVPESLLDKDIRANLIYIKDGKYCEYAWPISIPADRYSLADVSPKLLNPKQFPFLKQGIVGSHTMYFNFNRGMSAPDKQSYVGNLKGTLKSAQIVSHSSVEGDSITNSRLQKDRANYIESYLKKTLNNKEIPIEVKSNENWERLNFQLEILGLDSLKEKSHDELRAFISNDTIQNWDSLLYIQRRSHATVSYQGVLKSTDSLYYEQNFRTAVYYKKIGLANRALAEIYNNKHTDLFIFTPAEFKFVLSEPSLAQNSAAILSESYIYDIEKSVLFLRHWLQHEDKLSKDAKYNLSILYCKVVSDILDSWDISRNVFTKIVSPSKIISMVSEFNGLPEYNKILLNYHLTAIMYYGQTNYQQGLKTSFDFIESYFKEMVLDIEDEIELCLFFNSWSRYDLTIQYLFKRMKQRGFTEDAAFILAKTCVAYPASLSETEVDDVMNRAFRFNKKRWCNWIKNDFQILRHKQVKDIYCEECKE